LTIIDIRYLRDLVDSFKHSLNLILGATYVAIDIFNPHQKNSVALEFPGGFRLTPVQVAEKFLELDAAFTFSILPFSPFQKIISHLANDKGLEVMLHLPMEPMEYPAVKPGPGALLTTMSPDQLISQLEKNLETLPTIKGVNNHMGSKLTAESNQLYQIFSILKKRGLFFVDSRTTAKTLCEPSARMFKVPFAQRDVFIDHRQQPEFMRQQIISLIEIASQHGQAVGIAHPHVATYTILKEMLPVLKEKVQLVPASTIVKIIE